MVADAAAIGCSITSDEGAQAGSELINFVLLNPYEQHFIINSSSARLDHP